MAFYKYVSHLKSKIKIVAAVVVVVVSRYPGIPSN